MATVTKHGRYARNSSQKAANLRNTKQSRKRSAALGGQSGTRTTNARSSTGPRRPRVAHTPLAWHSETMKDRKGKTRTYTVATDSRGRKYIKNDGQTAPEGYYGSVGRRNFALAKNVRLHRDTPEAQLNWAKERKDKLLGAYMTSADYQGQIGKIDGGKGDIMNLRKTTAARRDMDAYEAYGDWDYGTAGEKTRKSSRYSVVFGQDGHFI